MPDSNVRLNALLLLAVLICALSVVTSQHKARKLFIEMQKEKEFAKQMEVEWGQLQLEQSTWATPSRVEKVAVEKLKMHYPMSEDTQYIRLGAGTDNGTLPNRAEINSHVDREIKAQ